MNTPTSMLIAAAVVWALCVPAHAASYDEASLQATIESLSPQTLAGWEQRAQRGEALAQNVLGMAYKYGMGTRQDHARSAYWFRQAAEQGDPDAQFNLGRIYGKAIGLYAKGRAAPRNDVEALKWYRRSAEQGYVPAQLNLAELLADGGQGVPRDDIQAYAWMSLAARSDEPNAAAKLEGLAARMTAAQLKRARALANDWRTRFAQSR